MLVEFIDQSVNRKMLINTDRIDDVINMGPDYNYTSIRVNGTTREVAGSYLQVRDILENALGAARATDIIVDSTPVTKGRKRNDK